ncbi:MAG: hypothetical protein J3K34DRAFT_50361 [Monoraphidium minutum]|nr:MAG: hypothetical protein J3K34DRAFT_50361 [Monoraphidium minutum]
MGANDWPVGRAWAWAVVMLFAAQAYAFPTEYVYKAGVACQDHPMRAMGAHGSPVPDPDTTFSFTDPGVQGAPAKVFCPGGSYGVAAKFPVRRLALLTASSGAVSADKRCPSRQYSGGKQSDGFSTTWSVPCDAAGESVVFKVTSAAGSKDNYHESGVTVGVGYTDGPCEAISKKAGCKPAPAPKAPLKPKPAAPKAAAPKATAKALPLLAKPGLKEAAEGAAKKFAPVKIRGRQKGARGFQRGPSARYKGGRQAAARAAGRGVRDAQHHARPARRAHDGGVPAAAAARRAARAAPLDARQRPAHGQGALQLAVAPRWRAGARDPAGPRGRRARRRRLRLQARAVGAALRAAQVAWRRGARRRAAAARSGAARARARRPPAAGMGRNAPRVGRGRRGRGRSQRVPRRLPHARL